MVTLLNASASTLYYIKYNIKSIYRNRRRCRPSIACRSAVCYRTRFFFGLLILASKEHPCAFISYTYIYILCYLLFVCVILALFLFAWPENF